jgi:hypothetical protein
MKCLKISMIAYILLTLSLETSILLLREEGESFWLPLDNKTLSIAATEIFFYSIGSLGSIFSYWYAYKYFKNVITIMYNK